MASPGIGAGELWAGLADLPMKVHRFKQGEEDRANMLEDIRRRRQQEDTQTARQDEMWQNHQSEQAARNAEADAMFDYTVGQENPVQAFWDHSQGWSPQAPKAGMPADGGGPGRTPAVANPNPAAGPAVTTADQRQSAAVQPEPVQQPQIPPPMPPEMTAMSREYEDKIQNPMRNAWARLQAQGKATPSAKRALMDLFKDRNKDFETRFGAMVEAQKQAVIRQKADAMVDAVERHDTGLISSMYGAGAKATRDPRTGLDAVQLPDGTYVGQDVVVARALLKAGLIDAKGYAKAAADAAKNQMELLKEREKMAAEMQRVRLQVSSDRNKEIEAAREAQRLTNQMNDPRTPAAAKPGIKAALDRLLVPVTKANAYVDYTHQQAMSRLDKQGTDEVNRAIAQAGGDQFKGVAPIAPKQAVDRMLAFAKKDPTGALATAYMTGLSPEQNAACQAKLDSMARQDVANPTNSGDAGGNKGPKPTVERNGKTYYLWSDGNYHTKRPPEE